MFVASIVKPRGNIQECFEYLLIFFNDIDFTKFVKTPRTHPNPPKTSRNGVFNNSNKCFVCLFEFRYGLPLYVARSTPRSPKMLNTEPA